MLWCFYEGLPSVAHHGTNEFKLIYKIDGYPKMAKQNGGNARKKGSSGRSYRNATGLTRQPKKMRGRKVSSQRWLTRQLNDPFVAEAKARGFRSRAALKLEQIDDRYKLLKPGMAVVDLGCAPGVDAGCVHAYKIRQRPGPSGGY